LSRNLGKKNCDYCGGDVTLVGSVAPITEKQAHRYFDEFEGMLVADAQCSRCEAKYLAWVDQRPCVNPIHRGGHSYGHSPDEPFFDLSFRSTFNDEPGAADKPKYKIVERYDREPWTGDEYGHES